MKGRLALPSPAVPPLLLLFHSVGVEMEGNFPFYSQGMLGSGTVERRFFVSLRLPTTLGNAQIKYDQATLTLLGLPWACSKIQFERIADRINRRQGGWGDARAMFRPTK
ncbi:hypothetical protein BDZ91DRAFT_759171 [Kalaharituber pfeilii]|nr:hypothetical protein BDZ91DRAFT_759171 [Kalaharituber pfeilii]